MRLDNESERALHTLESSGMTRSEAIRSSLLASAARLRHGHDLAAEAAALEADETDRTEMLAVAGEHLGAVATQRLGDRVGDLTSEEMWSVDDALVTVLGLN